MTPRIPAPAGAIAVVLIAAAALAGCGKMGQLDRPGPIFGHTAKAANGQAAAAPPAHSEDPTRPVRTIDPRDLGMDPVPPREEPIPGQSSDPTAQQPPGVLPNPYASPQ